MCYTLCWEQLGKGEGIGGQCPWIFFRCFVRLFFVFFNTRFTLIAILWHMVV